MHDRRVARIITPGTLIDENFIDPYVNNYVLAIHLCEADSAADTVSSNLEDRPVMLENPADASVLLGLAWLDLSTGSFFTQSATLLSLPSILTRLSPREVVLDQSLETRRGHSLFTVLAEDKYLLTYAQQTQLGGVRDWEPMLESEVPSDTANAFTQDEVKAGSLLLCYVKDRLQGLNLKLQPPLRHESRQVMAIDKNSMRSLEIKQTIRDSAFRGSLLHAIRRTVTRSGARLLNEWISMYHRQKSSLFPFILMGARNLLFTDSITILGSPSTSLDVIKGRQDLVSRFIQDEHLRDTIVLLLKQSHDSQRLVQKFALNRGDPDDLLRLANTIKATEDIANLIKSRLGVSTDPQRPDNSPCLTNLLGRINLEQPMKLWRRIHDAIDEEGLVQQHQVEDSEAGEMLSLAKEVVDSEGAGEDGSVLPKTAKKRKTVSIREHYGEDNEVWIMKPQASPRLQKLHAKLAGLLEDRTTLAETLRARLDAPSLTLRWTPGLGHICHVKGKDARLSAVASAMPPTKTLSASRTTRSFHQPEWSDLGERLDKARFQIRQEEQRVFVSLREAVVLNLVKLRRNSAVLDELDITTSFAHLAVEQNLTRPTVVDGPQHTLPPSWPTPATLPTDKTLSNRDNRDGNTTTPETIIIAGRHPTVEGGLVNQGRTFTPNDLIIGGQGPSHGRVWLITGPNMAGKSTFLRQNALITILAQAGCFVPAAHATVGLVDAIYSRVGSADNLYADQSTFMVEMLETAAILRQATPRSFVVMDEIGRGTTPTDGAAVAFAALDHLVRVNRCRALFATHFHAVADLVARRHMRLADGGPDGAVEMYCTDVEEDGRGGFLYVHKLRKGINRQSHALKVARLAGLPEQAIRTARDVLAEFEAERYEAKDGNKDVVTGTAAVEVTG